MTTQLQKNAPDNSKAEFWMQLCKTLASDLWNDAEKIQQPDATAELVIRSYENHTG